MPETFHIKKYLKELGSNDLNPLCSIMNANPKKVKKLICGKKIGSGVYRDVYELRLNPKKYVVKIEREPKICMFANVTEFRNWINFKDWVFFNKWLAPCLLISVCGTILIQKRANWEGKKRKDYPKYIPTMFTDTKLKNFGWLDGQFVCFDYSYLKEIVSNKKMKYANWWGTLKQKPL